MILETLDGQPFKRFTSDDDDDEPETELKVEISSPHVWWYPKLSGVTTND